MTETPERVRTLGAVLFPNFELLDFYGPLEMFGCIGPELKIVTVAENAGPVTSLPGVETVAQKSFSDCPDLDLLFLPGGVGTISESQNPAILKFLRERGERAEITMSVCSGSALLAHAGLLEGRKATTNKLYFDMVLEGTQGVEWLREARWVEDLPFVTSSGVSAGTDMSLAVIAHLYGRERAEQIATFTEYEWADDASRDPFAGQINQGDPGILATLSQG